VNSYGRDGWEMVSVQQVFRGHEQIGNHNAQGWAYGFALGMGFLLFFQRSCVTALSD